MFLKPIYLQMENIRKIIRKQLFKLLENYPAGTVNDPNAPWNQSDSKHIDAITPSTDTFEPLYFNNEITILKDKKDNSKWFFYNFGVDKNDFFPYSGAEDKSKFIGNDEDGQPAFDEEYNWELNGKIVADYVNDKFNDLSKGEGLEAYQNGVDLIKIDEPVKAELIQQYKDNNLKTILS